MGHNKPSITDTHINQIRQLISDNPDWNRTKLSRELCELWDWKSSVGQIKDISARDLLRSLDKKGLIQLPPPLCAPRAPGRGADKIVCLDHDTRPIQAELHDIMPICIETITSKEDVRLFKSYIHQFHYLGYDRSIGESMMYIIYSSAGTPLSCVMFGSAAWRCYDRDKYVGWNEEQRQAGLTFVTNQSRFLIFPWIQCPHLASHILGAISRKISGDWQAKYGHPLFFLETYVERKRFRGTCYKAANWLHVGITAGLGRNHTYGGKGLPLKDIYIYPLCCDFKERLCGSETGAGIC